MQPQQPQQPQAQQGQQQTHTHTHLQQLQMHLAQQYAQQQAAQMQTSTHGASAQNANLGLAALQQNAQNLSVSPGRPSGQAGGAVGAAALSGRTPQAAAATLAAAAAAAGLMGPGINHAALLQGLQQHQHPQSQPQQVSQALQMQLQQLLQTQQQPQQLQHFQQQLQLLQQAAASQPQQQQAAGSSPVQAAATLGAAGGQQPSAADLANLQQIQSMLRLQLMLGQQQSSSSGQLNSGQQNLMRQYQNIQQRLAAIAQAQQPGSNLMQPLAQSPPLGQHQILQQIQQQLAASGQPQNPALAQQLINAMLLQQQQGQPQNPQQRQQILQIIQAQMQNQPQIGLGLSATSASTGAALVSGNADSAQTPGSAAPNASNSNQNAQLNQANQSPTPQPARATLVGNASNAAQQPAMPSAAQSQQQQRASALVNAALMRGNPALAQQISALSRNAAASPQALAASPTGSPQPNANAAAGKSNAASANANSSANNSNASTSSASAPLLSAVSMLGSQGSPENLNALMSNPSMLQQSILHCAQNIRQIDEALASQDVPARTREQMTLLRMRFDRELGVLKRILAMVNAQAGGSNSADVANVAAQLAAATQLARNQQNQQQQASIIANLARAAAGASSGLATSPASSNSLNVSPLAAGLNAAQLLMPSAAQIGGTAVSPAVGSVASSNISAANSPLPLQLKGQPLFPTAPTFTTNVFKSPPLHGFLDSSAMKMEDDLQASSSGSSPHARMSGRGAISSDQNASQPQSNEPTNASGTESASGARPGDSSNNSRSNEFAVPDKMNVLRKIGMSASTTDSQHQNHLPTKSSIATILRQALDVQNLQQSPSWASYGRTSDQMLDISLWRRPPELDIPQLFGQQRKRRLQTLILQSDVRPWTYRTKRPCIVETIRDASSARHMDISDTSKRLSPSKPKNTSALMNMANRMRSTISDILDPEIDDILLSAADNFIEQVTYRACKIARHRRGANRVEVRDVQVELEQNWNLRVPGFPSDRIRTLRKQAATAVHQSRFLAVQRARRERQNAIASRAAAIQKAIEDGMVVAKAKEDAEMAAIKALEETCVLKDAAKVVSVGTLIKAEPDADASTNSDVEMTAVKIEPADQNISTANNASLPETNQNAPSQSSSSVQEQAPTANGMSQIDNPTQISETNPKNNSESTTPQSSHNPTASTAKKSESGTGNASLDARISASNSISAPSPARVFNRTKTGQFSRASSPKSLKN